MTDQEAIERLSRLTDWVFGYGRTIKGGMEREALLHAIDRLKQPTHPTTKELEKLCREWDKIAQENAGYKVWYVGYSASLRFCAMELRRLLKRQTPKLRSIDDDLW